MATAQSSLPANLCCQRVAYLQRAVNPAECVLANGTKLLLSALLAGHIAGGNEITFPVASPSVPA